MVDVSTWLMAFDGLKPVADARVGPVTLTTLGKQ
jgi:hypothetical protein